MNETRWEEWFAEVDHKFRELKSRHQRVFVAGFSMGGALSLRLATIYRNEIEGLLLVNPSIGDDRLIMRLVPLLKYFIPSVKGRGTDVAAPNPPRHSYGRTPLRALHSLQKLWRVVRRDLHLIDQPLMIGYSINDHVVNPKFSELLIDNVSSMDIREVIFERSFHNVALDYDLPILAEESVNFIREVLSGNISRKTDSELIDDEFESIVSGLSLDQSAPSGYLDELDNLDALEKYEGDNKELPTLTQAQRAALLGVIGGPIYVALVEIFKVDLLGIGFWPGLVALVSGVITFFWQMKPENDPGDGSAI
jgi:carboxylesterase